MSTTDKKLILRVLAKLLALFALFMMAYALLGGLLQGDDELSDAATVVIDVSALVPGRASYHDLGRRQILVLNRGSGQYLVAYAQDPVYGCPLQWRPPEFVAICNGSRFNRDGKVFPDQATDEDMRVLGYEETGGRLSIKLQ